MAERIYRVPDVSCEHCVKAISGELQKIDGVEAVDVNIASKLVSVRVRDSVDDRVLRAGIEEAGYEVAK